MKIGVNMDKQRVIVQFLNGDSLDFDATQARLSKDKEYITGIMVGHPRGGFISSLLEFYKTGITGDFFINMHNTTFTLIIPSNMLEENSDE